MKTINGPSVCKSIRMSMFLVYIMMLNCQLSESQSYAVGADLSFMKQAEDNGFAFKENGSIKPCLQIFKDHGYNWIRLRLFHTPTELPNNLQY